MPTVNIGDVALYYKVFRDGRPQENVDSDLPTLIVLHGGPGFVDHTLYVPFWSHFSIFMQVIFPDQRGNGLSEHGDPAKWNLKECGKDIYLFCETLKIKKPIIAGISWGGYVAMSYVSQYPDHPQALIFCNTEAKISSEARKEMFTLLGGKEAGEAVWQYDNHPEQKDAHEKFIKLCMPHYAKYRPYTAAQLSNCKTNYPMREKFMREENLSFDFRESLNKVVCPILLLAGDCDAGHPLKCARETAESIPQEFSNLVIINNAGAPVYNDQPALVFAKTLDFITKYDENVANQMPKAFYK